MLPDAERLAVAWAKADAPLAALLDGRVATRLPEGWVSPFLRVVQVDGDPAGVHEEAALGQALLQWDVFAFKGDQTKPDYLTAADVVMTLIDQAFAFTGQVVGVGYICGFSAMSGPRRIEEPETRWARYSFDTTMTMRG